MSQLNKIGFPVPAYAQILKLLRDERWANTLVDINITGPGEVWIDTGDANQPLSPAEGAFATRQWLDQLAEEVGAKPEAEGRLWRVERFDGLAINVITGPNVQSGMSCCIRRLDVLAAAL